MRPSQNIPPFSRNLYVRPFQNLFSLSEYTTLFNKFICSTLQEFTPSSQNIPPPPPPPSFSTNLYVRTSQNLPLPLRIYPLFTKFVCATLPESTLPSQNILPFQQIYMCNPPRIYPSFPEYYPFQQLYATLPESTPPSQNITLFTNCMRPSQNLPLPPRI